MSFFKKIVLGGVFFSFVFFAMPQTSYAYLGIGDIVIDPTNLVQNVITAVSSGLQIGKFSADIILRTVARAMIQKITAQTVNWINSGFNGNPAYVTDPGQFFLNIGDQAASYVLSGPGLNQLCTPFQAKVRIALVKNYLNADSLGGTCTLSAVKNNFEQFANDFSQGGWDGWYEVTQTSGGNPYSAYYNAQNSLNNTVNTDINKYTKQLDQNKGFLSYEKCDTNAVGYIAPRDIKVGDQTVHVPESCPKKETVTPGSVIESQLENSLGTGVRQLELAKNFDEVISALVTNLITKVVGGVGTGGLRGTADSIPTPTESATTITNKPTITLSGPNPLKFNVGDHYEDPGATAFDFTDGDITRNIVASPDTIDTSTEDTHTVTYTVQNSKGIAAVPVTRIVDVIGLSSASTSTTSPTTSSGAGGSGTSGGTTGSSGPANLGGTPPPPELKLSADPFSGSLTFIGPVTLTATHSKQQGKFYYYFYCDRNQIDVQLPPIPPGFMQNPFPASVSNMTYSSPEKCTYTAPGTYHPKVTSWFYNDANGNYIGNNTDAYQQATTTVTVQ